MELEELDKALAAVRDAVGPDWSCSGPKGEQQRVVSFEYCQECGGFIGWNTKQVLLSNPPKYKGECVDCGSIVFAPCSHVDVSN